MDCLWKRSNKKHTLVFFYVWWGEEETGVRTYGVLISTFFLFLREAFFSVMGHEESYCSFISFYEDASGICKIVVFCVILEDTAARIIRATLVYITTL